VRDPDNGTHNDELDEMPHDEREPNNQPLPPPPERAGTPFNLLATTTDNLPATTTDNLLVTTTDNLPATAIDNLPLTTLYNPLPAGAAMDRLEEGSTTTTTDGDDLTPGTPDTDAQSTAKNTVHVAPPAMFLHEYETAEMSLLFLFTKEAADAALAVRLRTEISVGQREGRLPASYSSPILTKSCLLRRRGEETNPHPVANFPAVYLAPHPCPHPDVYAESRNPHMPASS
jgi:hypothetical protein